MAAKAHLALRISTVDADGWPHAALLNAGEILALPGGRIRLAIFPKTAAAANLARDGRLTLTMALDRGLCELWMRARKLGDGTVEVPLAVFEAWVERARKHATSYADVESGVTSSLHDPAAVLARWYCQIAALRDMPATEPDHPTGGVP